MLITSLRKVFILTTSGKQSSKHIAQRKIGMSILPVIRNEKIVWKLVWIEYYLRMN